MLGLAFNRKPIDLQSVNPGAGIAHSTTHQIGKTHFTYPRKVRFENRFFFINMPFGLF